MSKIPVLILLFTACWLASPGSANGEEKTYYTMGIVPQQSATKLARLWVPILRYLSEKSALNLRFKTAPNIPTFEQRVAEGEYDFAYMNPYHYTVFHASPGYVAFAHEADKRLQGILVVRKDSPVQALKELAGETLAFPAPAAFAASVLPRTYLHGQGIKISPKYVASHDSVYRSVAKGLYPAGGGVMRTFRNMDPAITEQLRILWTTEDYTPHAFAAHPSLPIGIVDRLQRAMLSMHEDPGGRQMLERIKVSAFSVAHDSEWDDVRRLNLQLLDAPLSR
jgi:phosphonate transport system substrate-binding protein